MDIRTFALNPTFTIRIASPDQGEEPLHIATRVLDRGMQVTRLRRATDPQLFDFLLQVVRRTVTRETALPAVEKLERIGFLVPCSRLGDLYDKIAQLWDGELDEFLPIRFQHARVPPVEQLVVNPSLKVEHGWRSFQRHNLALLRNLLGETDAVVTVRDPGSLVTSVFPVSPTHLSRVEKLCRPVAVKDLGLSAREIRRYWTAALLVRPKDLARSRQRWSQYIRECPNQLAAKGYFRLPSISNPYLLAAMRKHFRAEISSARLEFGDEQSQRWNVADEPFARYLLLEMTEAMTGLSGKPQSPLVVYFGAYVGGAQLERHVDREEFGLAVSQLVDFEPEPQHLSSWPLCIEGPEQPPNVHEERQMLGDAILFRGRERPHFRPPLSSGCTSSSLFLIYREALVMADGSPAALDQLPRIHHFPRG